MKNFYPVMRLGREVGTAAVEREGLYYRIYIECKLSTGVIKRAFVYANDKKIPLGVCVPRGDRFFVDKRIAASKLSLNNLRFIIGEDGFRHDCSQAWKEIYRIADARLIIKPEGKVITTDPGSGQQGSGQNR